MITSKLVTRSELNEKIHKRILTELVMVIYRDVQGDSLHLHLLDDEDEGLVPVGIQVAALHARLLFLPDPLLLGVEQLELDVGVRGSRDVHLLQLAGLEHGN